MPLSVTIPDHTLKFDPPALRPTKLRNWRESGAWTAVDLEGAIQTAEQKYGR